MKVFAEFKIHTSLVAFEMFSDKALAHVMSEKKLQAPFASSCPFYVLAEVEGFDQSDDRHLQVFERCLGNEWLIDGVVSQSETQAKQFWRLREDISESLAKFSPYKNDVAVAVSLVPAFIKDLDGILGSAYPDWEVVWFGHVGDGNLHINILRPSGMSKEEFVSECRKVDQSVFSIVKKYKGSISAEHGVGLTKKSFLSYSRSPAEIDLMKKIKKAFDPENIINTGKLFDL
jgi:FAD/FMN-containing dehydrogenase